LPKLALPKPPISTTHQKRFEQSASRAKLPIIKTSLQSPYLQQLPEKWQQIAFTINFRLELSGMRT